MTNANDVRQKAVNDLLTECRVFWAFSNSQFEEGVKKTALEDGDKLIDIGMGGFMPKSCLDKFTTGMEAINKAFDEAMKDEKARVEYIKYELNNHEAGYTRNIDSTMEALGEGFTREEVAKVFHSMVKYG